MNKSETTKILRQTIAIYGHISQCEKAIEEMGELIHAISKYNRAYKALYEKKKHTNATFKRIEKAKQHMITEMADVEIMMKQMRFIFGNDMIDKWIDFKLRRLRNRNDANIKF